MSQLNYVFVNKNVKNIMEISYLELYLQIFQQSKVN